MLQPFITSLQQFFDIAVNVPVDEESKEVPVLSSNNARREMSKLFYTQEKFDLNLKADAFEAYDQILTCISSYIRHAKVHPGIQHVSEQNSSAAQLAELAEFECNKDD